ncbi:MAG: prenyltransferase [Acidobacteria bacterium]|nr:prenyltransferase [Acidobacteriota bacterium]
MTVQPSLGVWLRQVRAPFLVLAMALTLLGIATAHWHGFDHAGHSLLLVIGVVLAHAAVNLFNELSDHGTGIDAHTERTPFSGGSGMLQAGKTTPRQVRLAAYGTLLAAGAIGLYFCLASGWPLLALMACGALAIRFYTSHLSRWRVGELVSGLTLGSFVVIGSHYALTSFMTLDVLYISLPPGLLTALLLFLNEFPDAEADRRGGRRHLVIAFGRKKSAMIYAVSVALVFVLIAAGPFILNIPHVVLIALLALPLGVAAAAQALRYHDDPPRLVPAQALNVALVIVTDLLLALAYFL